MSILVEAGGLTYNKWPYDKSIHLARVHIGPAVGKPYSIAAYISSIRPDGLLARDRYTDY
ncbi:hypothetical protein ACFL41_02475 [Gemmatimonadota bacterium]